MEAFTQSLPAAVLRFLLQLGSILHGMDQLGCQAGARVMRSRMGFYRELALRTRAFVWSKRNQEAAEKSSEKHRQYKDFSFVRAAARVKTPHGEAILQR
jgi:hypothetical protein